MSVAPLQNLEELVVALTFASPALELLLLVHSQSNPLPSAVVKIEGPIQLWDYGRPGERRSAVEEETRPLYTSIPTYVAGLFHVIDL
jgi:hypothetical protein